jgi:hypothetical protein
MSRAPELPMQGIADLQGELQGEDLYYKGAPVEALNEYRKLSKEEREKLKKGDEIDGIPTSDLEKDVELDPEGCSEISYDFLQRHRINIARALYGADGGMTVRRLKKMLWYERKNKVTEKEDSKKQYDKRQALKRGEEAAPEEEGAEAANAEDIVFSDESDLEDALENIPDEDWDKILEELNGQRFTTEDEAKAYFETKLKDWSRTRNSKRKVTVDEREQTDPYYAMLKKDKEIASRYQDHFDLDDYDAHAYLDQVEKNIGRYSLGFRQYENYENYRVMYPDATI